MAETSTLTTIGRFSAPTRLSVRMIRHDDTHGADAVTDVCLPLS